MNILRRGDRPVSHLETSSESARVRRAKQEQGVKIRALASYVMRNCLFFLAIVALPLLAHAASWEMTGQGQRALEALRKGDVAAVKRSFGADNKPGLDPRTILEEALPTAFESGSVELIQFLKYKGWLQICREADRRRPSETWPNCYPILRVAGTSGSVPLIRYLISEGFDPRTPPDVLHAAAYSGRLQAVKFFCEQGFDATVKSRDGDTALEKAIGGLLTKGQNQERRHEFEDVIEYLRGRTCKVGAAYPVLAGVPASRSATLKSVRRSVSIIHNSLLHTPAHICAQFGEHEFECWYEEHLPIRFDSVVPVGNDTAKLKVIQTAFGLNHTCTLFETGSIRCWGDNSSGQLGTGDTHQREVETPEQIVRLPVVDIGPDAKAREIATGVAETCVLLNSGLIKCWGGGIGVRPGQMGAHLPAIELEPQTKAVHLAGSGGHFCAVLSNGAVKCWGGNNFGELGLGDTHRRLKPDATLPAVDFGAGLKATQIAVGSTHSCALLDNARVKCWGGNYRAQLGVGDARGRGDDPNEMGDNLPFVDLGKGLKAVQIVAYRDSTCALLDNGGVKCWGDGRGYFSAEMGDNLPYVKFQ